MPSLDDFIDLAAARLRVLVVQIVDLGLVRVAEVPLACHVSRVSSRHFVPPCDRQMPSAFGVLVLLVLDAARIVAVGILVPDLSVAAVNHDLAAGVLRDFTRALDRLLLGR